MARILVSMPDKFLESVDELAQSEQRTRSELVREALRTYVQKSRATNPIRSAANAKVLEELLD